MHYIDCGDNACSVIIVIIILHYRDVTIMFVCIRALCIAQVFK